MSPAIFDAAFYLRCTLGLAAGLALLAGGAPAMERRWERRPPTWAVIVIYFAQMLMLSASLMLGGAAGVSLANALFPGNQMALAALALVIGVAAVWSGAVLSQILTNLVRARLGLKPYKLELWRR